MPISPSDIFVLTARGRNELRGGATSLTPNELELLILIDGIRPVSAFAEQARTSAPVEIVAVLERLSRNGYIGHVMPAENADGSLEYFFSSGNYSPEPSEQALARAAAEAVAGASKLREEGYYVSIARRARGRNTPSAHHISVLVIEDEPLVAKYLRALIEMEGFVARLASNREEITAQLRQPPIPDLVILDVMLPDINGFEVLQRMRGNAKFGEVPVIVVTTQATRESVMKGLALGADGYITKPFEVDVLVRGIKAVLGLLAPARDSPVPIGSAPWQEKDTRKDKLS